jgi:lactoylglutathione lyase
MVARCISPQSKRTFPRFGRAQSYFLIRSIGLAFPESDAEIVLHREGTIPSSVEVHYLVDDVVVAVAHYAAQGCQTLVASFDITIGKCAVIRDPFGTRLCILDTTKGLRPPNLE